MQSTHTVSKKKFINLEYQEKISIGYNVKVGPFGPPPVALGLKYFVILSVTRSVNDGKFNATDLSGFLIINRPSGVAGLPSLFRFPPDCVLKLVLKHYHT